MSISEVALSPGFSDQSHFSQAFRKMTGTTPKRYDYGSNPAGRAKKQAHTPLRGGVVPF